MTKSELQFFRILQHELGVTLGIIDNLPKDVIIPYEQTQNSLAIHRMAGTYIATHIKIQQKQKTP